MKDVMTGTTIIYRVVTANNNLSENREYKVKDLKDFQKVISLGMEKKVVILEIDGYTADYYFE